MTEPTKDDEPKAEVLSKNKFVNLFQKLYSKNPDRPGLLTSELWITIALLVVGWDMCRRGDQESGIQMIGLVVAGYSVSRGISKR